MEVRIGVAPGEPAADDKKPAPTVTETAGGALNVSDPAPNTADKPADKPADVASGDKPADKPADKTVPRIEPPKVAPKFDASAAVAEFGKDGKVSEATYAKYAEQGVDRAALDTFVAGHKAQVDGVVHSLTSIAGDADSLRAVVEWAGANVDAATAAAFNAAMDSADATTASLMFRGLMSQYNEAVGTEGTRVVGANLPNAVQAFDSWEQVREQMNDRRYNVDPAFRATVERRMAAAMKAGKL